MKDGFVKVAAATPSIRVADTAHNAGAIMNLMAKAAVERAKILVLPELCITGYTCGDLLLQEALLEDALKALGRIVEDSRDLDMLIFVGLPAEVDGGLYNCAAAVWNGRLLGLVPKSNLPNFAEFYEKRWFVPGSRKVREIRLGELGSVPFGTDLLFCHGSLPELCVAAEICEDLWVPNPPSSRHALAGATVIVNLSASNEVVTKDEYRRGLIMGQSARLYCGYVYASSGDGESTTDLVFTGDRLICENGELLAESGDTEGIIFSELDLGRLSGQRRKSGVFTGGEEGYVTVYWGRELEDTRLTRYVSRLPFVPEDVRQRTARCEKILKLQSLGLKKRIEHSGARRMVLGVS
ncbi:MAG: nitrilase-related carbon-nitrogen hydrolase, partial [Oscillospiraceae bacterium]